MIKLLEFVSISVECMYFLSVILQMGQALVQKRFGSISISTWYIQTVGEKQLVIKSGKELEKSKVTHMIPRGNNNALFSF